MICPPKSRSNATAKGWELYLDRLTTRVTGGDPGPDPKQGPRAGHQVVDGDPHPCDRGRVPG